MERERETEKKRLEHRREQSGKDMKGRLLLSCTLKTRGIGLASTLGKAFLPQMPQDRNEEARVPGI